MLCMLGDGRKGVLEFALGWELAKGFGACRERWQVSGH